MSDGLERNTRTVMSLTMVSRFSGLVREGVLSRLFGTDAVLGAFYFAFLIPNLFRRLFGEGALAAAFLPEYQRLLDEDPQRARAMAGLTAGGLLAGLGALVVVAECVLLLVTALPGTPGPALWLTMIMLPFAPLICGVALLGAMLQVHGRFGPTAAAPVILNVCLAGAAGLGWWLIAPDDDRGQLMVAAGMAGSVVLAGLLQAAWSMFALRRLTRLTLDRSGLEGVRRVLRRMGPMLLGLGVLQVNTLLDGLIASWPVLSQSDTVFGMAYPLDDHAMSTITFAQRLYHFPLGVFGIAVATAIYPLLSSRAADEGAFGETIRRGLRLVVFIGLPAGIGLLLVRRELTAVLLEGGNFGASDTDRVAFVLAGYATSIWAYSAVQVLTRGFYALGKLKTPVRVAASTVALNLVLNLILIWTPLREAGLAWSTAICATIQAVVLWILLHRHNGQTWRQDLAASMGKSVIATGVMAGAVLLVALAIGHGDSFAGWLWRLSLLVGIGGSVHVLMAIAMGMPELHWALGRTIGDTTSEADRSQTPDDDA
ncbi:MAG: murein biosynthesis integral membrane protein MurJ [Phycisphaerales bacterium]|nr:murein biosynthesis integral membrane protein MurJ [Phycisphaerales bacterium]